jgi:hypothetical protein
MVAQVAFMVVIFGARTAARQLRLAYSVASLNCFFSFLALILRFVCALIRQEKEATFRLVRHEQAERHRIAWRSAVF